MRIEIGKPAPNPANFATFEAFAEAYVAFAESIRQVPLKRKGTGKYTYGVQIGSKPVIYGAKAKAIWEAHQRGQQQKPVAAKRPAKAQPKVNHHQGNLGSEKLIRDSYEELKLFKEFRDGLVEIPRLFEEAKRRNPTLKLENFHKELERLSAERKLEMHKLNEVDLAKRPELAINKGDRMYYYVMWKPDAEKPKESQEQAAKAQPAKATPSPKAKDQKPASAGGDLTAKAKYVYGNAAGLDDKDIDAFIADVSNLGKNDALSVAAAIDLRLPKTASKSAIVAGIKERIVSRKGSFQRAHLLERPTSSRMETAKKEGPTIPRSQPIGEQIVEKDYDQERVEYAKNQIQQMYKNADKWSDEDVERKLRSFAKLPPKELEEIGGGIGQPGLTIKEIRQQIKQSRNDKFSVREFERKEADRKASYNKQLTDIDDHLSGKVPDKVDGATGDEEELSEIQKVPEQEPIRMETAKKDDKLGDSLSNLLKIAGSKGTGDFENDVAKLRMIDVIYLDRDLDRLREAGYGTNEAIRSAVDELSFMKQESESYSQRRKLTEKNINDRFDVVVGSINKAGNALKAIGNTDGSNVYLNDGVDIANKMREFAVKNYAVDSQSSNKADPDKRSNPDLDFSKSISDAVSKVSNDSATVMKQAESIVPKLQEKLKDVSPEVKKASQDFAKEQGPSVLKKIRDTLGDVSERTLYGAARLVGATAMTALGGALGVSAIAVPATLAFPALAFSGMPELGPVLFPTVFEGLADLSIGLFKMSGKSFSTAFDMFKNIGKGPDKTTEKFAETDNVSMDVVKKLAQEILSDLAAKWPEFAKKRGLKSK